MTGYVILLEVFTSERRSVEYEATVQAVGVAEAVKQVLDDAWQEFGEEAPIVLKRVALT